MTIHYIGQKLLAAKYREGKLVAFIWGGLALLALVFSAPEQTPVRFAGITVLLLAFIIHGYCVIKAEKVMAYPDAEETTSCFRDYIVPLGKETTVKGLRIKDKFYPYKEDLSNDITVNLVDKTVSCSSATWDSLDEIKM